MIGIVERLQAEEKQQRAGFPSPRREVADLLLEAADEIELLRVLLGRASPKLPKVVTRISYRNDNGQPD